MAEYLVDVRDHGALGDGATDDSGAFNKAAEHARQNGGLLVAVGLFKLANNVDIYTSADLSQARIIIENGAFSINQHDSEKKEQTYELSAGDDHLNNLTYLRTSLKDVLSDAILAEYANSFVIIEAVPTAEGGGVYIYRRNGEEPPAPQYKSSVTLLNDYGRLAYSLTHNYSNMSNAIVKITLRKLPSKRLRFIAPELMINKVRDNRPVLSVRRDLTDIIGLTMTRKVKATGYYALTHCFRCYDVTFQGASYPGYGVPNNAPPNTPDVRYDCILDKALKVRFDSINSSTGWKTIDGNNSRDIVVTNSVIDGFHGHFNIADVLVTGCTIANQGLSFGTGSADSSITVRDCKFLTRTNTPLGIRADFGELRGAFIVENCIFNLRDSTGNSNDITILSLIDSAIYRQDQPDWYSLPSSIVLHDIVIRSKGHCRLIAVNSGNIYGPEKRLAAPCSLDIDGVEATDVGGELRLSYNFIPYDAGTAAPVSIRLANVRAIKSSSVFSVELGSTADEQDKLHYRASISNVDNLKALFMGSARSEVAIDKSSLVRLDTFSFNQSTLKALALDGVTFKFGPVFDVGNDFNISPKLQRVSIVNCVFDATAYKQQSGSALGLKGRAHNVSGNIAIDCFGAEPEGYDAMGRRAVVPGAQKPQNYVLDADGLLRPTWPVP